MSKNKKKNLDVKYMGEEPDVSGKLIEGMELADVYNYLNYFYDRKDAKNWTLEFLKKIGSDEKFIKSVEGISESLFPQTVGWIARINLRGGEVNSDSKKFFKKTLKKYVKKYSSKVDDENEKTAKEKSPYDYLVSKANIIWEESFECDIDQFMENFKDTEFEPYKKFKTEETPRKCALMIQKKIEPLITEISSAIEGEKDWAEAYSYMTKKQMNDYKKYLCRLEESVSSYCNVKKKTRKPRKKKKSDVLKHFQYMKVSDEMKLASQDPQKIIGADYAVFFNTKNNRLIVLKSKNDEGLKIYRTSVQNFDETESFYMRIANIHTYIDGIMKANKKQTLKYIQDIKRKPVSTTGRINKDTLILKIY